MRASRYLIVAMLASASGLAAQRADKELVATLTGPLLDGGIVAALAWDGGTLVIQSAAMEPTGALKAGYFTTRGRGMQVVALAQAPPAVERYWKMKASRTSPTGLGKITAGSDARLPMYGIASLEQRLFDAHEMGGTQQTHELRLERLVIHSRAGGVEPYDGEVWSWSPPELNRIAYVDHKGDLWIARADGRNAERLMRGRFTLPAWSEDGRTLAVAERQDQGRRWEISVIHLPEQHRQ
ncbi:MAG: TolB family protein [Vicinamibacterales bacterium]